MIEPTVRINRKKWNVMNGLRITTITGHGGGNNMYTVEHARILARELNEACDKIESESCKCEDAFIELGIKLGFLDS